MLTRTRRTKSDSTWCGAPGWRSARLAAAAFLLLLTAAATSAGAAPGNAAATAALLIADAPSVTATSAEASPDVARARELIARVIERYDDARSYRIGFTQDSYWALADSTMSVSGVLLLERPGNISIRYADGGRIVVAQDSLWVYSPATSQFFVAAVDSADVALDPARLLRQFEPDRTAPFAAEPRGSITTLILKPSTAFSEPVRVEVSIDTNARSVTRIVAFASTGDRTTYTMHASSYDVTVPAGEFVLRRPEGTELITGSPYGSR